MARKAKLLMKIIARFDYADRVKADAEVSALLASGKFITVELIDNGLDLVVYAAR